jgi:nucleoside-diphosphate-sugar epimerase
VIGGRAKIDSDPLALAENLELDAAMFRWASRTRPGRVVYLSSSAVYPVGLQKSPVHNGPLKEWQQETDGGVSGHPDQVYGWSKLVGEMLAGKLGEAGVPVTVVRPFSGYGADQDPAYPFPAFIQRARRHADPFEVWGDGQQARDFIHVDDMVAATLTMAASGIDGPLNICTGRATSFDELAGLVCEAAGYRPMLQHHPEQPRGVAYRVGDPTRLLEVYEPKVTLEEGIRRALEAPT